MQEIVTRDELRAVLNPLLEELPDEAFKAAREGIEAELEAGEVTPKPTEGETRAVLDNVGPGYTALRDADCDIVKSLTSAGVSLLTKGASFAVVGELVALLFSIRRHGVELTVEQGVVLRVLRKNQPMVVTEIGDKLAEQSTAMTNEEVEAALAALSTLLNSTGSKPTIVCVDGRWHSVGV